MRSFVAWRNIERYRDLLNKETDEQRRRTLENLLAEEEKTWASLSEQEASQEPTRPTA